MLAVGAGTKPRLSAGNGAARLSLAGLRGIVEYDPDEYTFTALAGKSINIRAITTSEIKFSVLIDAAYTELAVRTLHTLYGLDHA